MAKAFDLIHKVAQSPDETPEGRIPFDESTDNQPPKKKRARVEIVFFYLLLFAIFFIMGIMFLSPNLFLGKNEKSASASPKPSNSPIGGFVITKEGQGKDLSISAVNQVASPTATSTPLDAAAPAAPNPPSKAARVQILNGTNRTGAAAALRTKLANRGIVVLDIGNYKKRTVRRTTVYYLNDYKKAGQDVLATTGGILVQTSSTTTGGFDVLVVIGQSS